MACWLPAWPQANGGPDNPCEWTPVLATRGASSPLCQQDLAFVLPRLGNVGHVIDDFIDQAILRGFLGGHKSIAVGVLLDLVEGMAGVLQQNLVHLLLDPPEFLGVDRDFLSSALHASEGLVDHDAGVG